MWSADQLAKVTNGKLIQASPTRVISGFSIDSRTIKQDECFVAIPGNSVDGHNFILEAFERGAAAALVEKLPEARPKIFVNLILVENSIRALQKIAQEHRKSFDIPIVGITGSSGKTTTKELLHHILSASQNSFRSPGNYNSEIGLPLGILDMPIDAECGIFELGLQYPGDIKLLSEILQPTHGLITHIGEAHLENFQDVEQLAEEKWELARCIQPPSKLSLNVDSTFLNTKSASPDWQDAKSFGISNERSEVRAVNIDTRQLSGLRAKILYPDGEFEMRSKLLGRSNVYAILAATAMAMQLGVSAGQIRTQISSFAPIEGRMELIESERFGHIIHDAYNANPASMNSAIQALNAFEVTQETRKVLVLGDMLELGAISEQRHLEVAAKIKPTKISHVFTFGERAKHISLELSKDELWQDNSTHCGSMDEVIDATTAYLIKHPSLTLVKGSRGMNLDILVNMLR